MRTKIGKRIGPVPIALVAVLALAALISAGLLLATNNGVTQAQELPPEGTAPGPDDKDCEVVIFSESGQPEAVTNKTVKGGGL